jgi:hypothetical protein
VTRHDQLLQTGNMQCQGLLTNDGSVPRGQGGEAESSPPRAGLSSGKPPGGAGGLLDSNTTCTHLALVRSAAISVFAVWPRADIVLVGPAMAMQWQHSAQRWLSVCSCEIQCTSPFTMTREGLPLSSIWRPPP